MNTLKHLRGALTLLLTLVFVANLLLVPQIARADGDKGKKKPHIPIIIGPPIIRKDPPKGPPKKNHDPEQSSDAAAAS